MKIAVVFDAKGPMAVTDAHLETLRRADPSADIRFASAPEELIEQGFKADALICWGTGGGHYICEPYCAFDDELKWIHCLSSGTEGVEQDPAVKRPGFILTCSKGIHGVPMANHVMGFILSFLRCFPALAVNQRKHLWQRPMPDEATGKRLCIIGLGNIGKEIAAKAKAFDMHVTGIKRSPGAVENVDEVLPPSELDKVLAQSDFVVMLLPINEANRGFMSKDRFDAMKPGSVFINVGRGQTVDEDALVEALRSGHLGGAALDALAVEPLPADSPLWDMENVIITPHLAADTPKYMDRAFELIAENVKRFEAGQTLRSLVDIAG